MKNVLITFFILLYLAGCGPRTYFIPSEISDNEYGSRETGCTIEMLLYDMPSDRQSDEIGVCKASYQAYSGKAYQKVIRAIKDCACKMGGNAIAFPFGNDTYYYDYMGQVTRFETSAIVLYINDADYLHQYEDPILENLDGEFDYDFDD